MKRGENQKIKSMACEFLIWRAGMSVKWMCSASDLAKEIDITPEAVRRICKRKGWKFQVDGRSMQNDRRPTDELMRSNYTGRN